MLEKNSIIFIAGSPGAGKSHLIKFLVYTYAKQFNYIYSICPTKYDGDYDYLPDKFVLDIYNEEFIEKLIDIQQSNNKKRVLLILDDILGSINFDKPLWQKITTRYRHLNISIIIATQYCKKIPILFRQCVSFAIIFRQNILHSFKGLYEYFGNEYGRFEDFKIFIMKYCEGYQTIIWSRDGYSRLKNNHYKRFTAPKCIPQFKIKM